MLQVYILLWSSLLVDCFGSNGKIDVGRMKS